MPRLRGIFGAALVRQAFAQNVRQATDWAFFPCYEVTIVKQILKFKSSARSRGLEIATLTTLLYVGWLPQANGFVVALGV